MSEMTKLSTVTPDAMGLWPQRVFPTFAVRYPDPFILLDHFAMKKPGGFPDHPHRGFEIISYVLNGAMAHTDNQGNATVIPAGGVQTVTAGRGLVHSELPATDGVDSGFQLWINLPRADKQMAPSYQEFDPNQIPEQHFVGVTVRTIVGEKSPIKINRPMVYDDVTMVEGARYNESLPADYQGFAYVMSGAGSFTRSNRTEIAAKGDLLLFSPDPNGWSIQVEASEGLRFVMIAGLPIGEIPRYNGPFVD